MMSINANYQQKLKWLTVAIIPVCLFCFRMSFYKTFQQKTIKKQLEIQLTQIHAKEDSNDYYRQIAIRYKKIRDNYLIETADDNRVMNFIASYNGGGIKILQYTPLATSVDHIWTRSFVLQGSFAQINSLIYQLEQTNKICRVASVNFLKSNATNKGEKKEVLQCTIYIQNIHNEKDSIR